MIPEIKALWTQALRSDEFEQGREALRYTDLDGHRRLCCLGVLCELHRRATGAGEWETGPYNDVYRTPDDQNGGYLPASVALWAGLPDGNPYVPRNTLPERRTPISTLNDGYNSIVAPCSFAEIADVIDANF